MLLLLILYLLYSSAGHLGVRRSLPFTFGTAQLLQPALLLKSREQPKPVLLNTVRLSAVSVNTCRLSLQNAVFMYVDASQLDHSAEISEIDARLNALQQFMKKSLETTKTHSNR